MIGKRQARIGLLFVLLSVAGAAIWASSGDGRAAMLRSDPEQILPRPDLRRVALMIGEPVYREHCASCHGVTGAGDSTLGVPALTGSRHLYGEGRVAEIEEIARHGIRSPDKRSLSLAAMPAYGTQHPYKGEPLPSLTPGQIEELTQYVLALRGRGTDSAAAAQGGVLYRDYAGCYDCHGFNAQGNSSIGAPSLVDGSPLYGSGSHDDIYRTLAAGRAGVSPAFAKLLSAAELRAVAVYVASLQSQPSQQANAR